MPVHDWTRVDAGVFHDFHTSWITDLKRALNAGVLPSGYYAMSEQHAGQCIPDVLTLSTTPRSQPMEMPEGPIALAKAPPSVSMVVTPDAEAAYVLTRRTLTIRHRSTHRIVGLVEVVSPANKDRASAVMDFVDKVVSAMKQGIHLLVIDLFPPGRFDPRGMHGEIWARIDRQEYQTPSDKRLTLAAYAVDTLPKAYIEPIAVGSRLPEMPLFLDPEWYVPAPLEATYMSAYGGVPEFWRDVVEGKEEPGR